MKWGPSNIGKVMWGSSEIGKIYYGSSLVYQSGASPGPQPDPYRTLDGIVFDGNVYYNTGIRLLGSDTLTFSFKASQNCNVLGCYTTTSATTNYSLYVSTSSSAKYLRYGNGTYNSSMVANTRYNVTITPTGSSGMRTNSTWTAKTFTAGADFLIGTTSTGATSAKMTGILYGNIEVAGRYVFVPSERIADGAIGYLIQGTSTFLTNQGSGTPTEYTS